MLLDDLSWSIGPGDRIGLVGVNGAGKTTLLRLLTGELEPDRGRVKQGKTLRIGHLSQARRRELDGATPAGAGVGGAAAPADPARDRRRGQRQLAAGGLRLHRRTS